MNTRQIYHVLWVCVIIFWSSWASAQDAADGDFAAELPRIAPTEPADALKTFEVVPGYQLELVAAEPLVTSPVAASFDEDSRLYVVEMRDYSEQAKEKLGRVRRLIDTDGNGAFDKSEVFAEGLSWPTAITTYDGGVFVGAAPDIWYLKDTDGDGRADQQRIVFTGFGRGNVQGLLNSFTWGIDNRIHVAVSSAGAELQRVDSASKPVGKPLTLRGRDFSFDPRNPDDFIATSGGGQHGMTFDDWGRKFVCSNSDHIQQIMLEDADLARNPYFIAPNPRISIAFDGPQADVYRISPIEPWREVRTRLRVKGIVPGPIEGGGRAAGYFTGATGITIYRGHAWPKEDRGLAIVGDVGGNLIHRKRLIPHGLEFRAQRIDEQREFIASRDNWFRPVQFMNAPDGALYVLDMYRETIEHPASLPPAIKKHLDLTSGRDRGRIYRIVPVGFKQPPLPKLSTATTAELVALLGHENGWHRDMAARLLYEREDPLSVAPLDKLVHGGKTATARLYALQVLSGLHGLTEKVVERSCTDEHEEVRAYAVRQSTGFAKSSRFQRGALRERSTDASLRVRQQVAVILGGVTGEARDMMLSRLLVDGLEDPWISASVLSSSHVEPVSILAGALEDERFCRHPRAAAMIEQLTAQIARDKFARALLVSLVDRVGVNNPAALHDLFAHNAPAAAAVWIGVWRGTPEKTKAVLRPVRDTALEVAGNSKQPLPERTDAIRRLACFADGEAMDVIGGMLSPSTPKELQTAAIEAVAMMSRSDGPIGAEDVVISRWASLTPEVRAEFVRALSKDSSFSLKIGKAIKAKQILATDVPLELRKQWPASDSPSLQPQDNDREKTHDTYRLSLKLSGDITRGAEHFKKHCSACHKLGDVGKEIGPNLAAMKNRGAEAILVNVLDPNREVNPQFVTYVVVTKDGRTLSGMIVAETATSLTVRRGEGHEDTVLRIDIEELRSTGQSLMPEGLEKQLDPQQMADVIAFILGQG